MSVSMSWRGHEGNEGDEGKMRRGREQMPQMFACHVGVEHFIARTMGRGHWDHFRLDLPGLCSVSKFEIQPLGIQIAQSSSYLHAFGPEVGIIYILGAPGQGTLGSPFWDIGL